MDYGVYKIIHIVSIVLFFAFYYGIATKKGKANKIEVIFTGILLVLILVGGFGLMARLGIPHGQWPLWIKLKFGIWFLVGILSHMIWKRFPHLSQKTFWVCVGLLTFAAYVVNYKMI